MLPLATGVLRVYHSSMKRLLIVLACLFVLILIAGLVVGYWVSGSSKDWLTASLSENLGVPVSIGSANFDLKQWFLLRPAIALEDVTIGNPPGFQAPHLLEAKKLSVQIALLPLLHKNIEVNAIDIDHPADQLGDQCARHRQLRSAPPETKGTLQPCCPGEFRFCDHRRGPCRERVLRDFWRNHVARVGARRR